MHPSVIEEEDDGRVIDKIPLPELHILMGVVNHIFWDKGRLISSLKRTQGDDHLWAEAKVISWASKSGAVSKSYHGRVFEGGACCKLQLKSGHLASHEYLEDVENKNQIIAISYILAAMNRLVDACFGNDLKGNVQGVF